MKTMKTVLSINSVLAALALTALPVKAQVTYWSQNSGWANGGYSDGAGIGSVVVNNTGSDITFTINTTQPMNTYPQYFVLMQYVGLGGSGSTVLLNSANALNGWGPSLGISTGMNAFLATWNGGGGVTAETYSGGTWSNNGGVGYAGGPGNSFITITAPLSSLGLSSGSQFYFDVVSSYSPATGQSAYNALDTLTHPMETDGLSTPWNGTSAYDPATDPAGTVFGTAASEYTIVSVPEPTTLALLSGGVILLLVQRRRVSGNRAV
jgi:hypothetical protein